MFEHLIFQRDYLLSVSRALTSQLSLSEVLRRILASATEMLGGHAGLIALAAEDTFEIRASYGLNTNMLHIFQPLVADIQAAGAENFAVPELSHKVRLIAQAAGIELKQVIALPMYVGEELVGVVFIFRTRGGGFTRNDMRLLQSFADQAAIAVHNARLYEMITKEKQRLDAILQHSADGIMILLPDETVESINLALAHMIGCTAEAAVGQPRSHIIQWAALDTEHTDLNTALEAGWPSGPSDVLYVEGDLKQRDGRRRSVGITYAPLIDTQGGLRNVIANVRDITKFREAEEAKSTFISVISHELKTPVSLIKGYAGTLLRDDVDWDKSTYMDGLRVVDEEADKLAELIDNLLDVNRLQSGTLSLRYQVVDVGEMLQGAAHKFSIQAPEHQISVDVPDEPVLIEADKQRLGQVFSNLISNAIKYSPAGGKITLQGIIEAGQLRIQVSDEGVGISPEHINLVFNRFFRVDNALTRETQGAGLGLFIVRSIIEAHNGRIWVESEPGKGTKFIFTLPLARQAD